MTFKVSLFNKGLMVSDFKRFWWVSALYGLFLILLLPFHHVVQLSANNNWAREMLQRSLDLFSGQSVPQPILICTVPIFMAVLLFRYLHNNRAVAVMHSLPFNRYTLFCSHTAAGVVLLLLPVLVTGLVLMLLNITTQLQEYYSLLDILRWMGITAFFDIFLFIIAVFVGMFTGNVMAHIAFTYILQVLPSGLHILVEENLRYLVYGYATISSPGYLRYDFPLMMLLAHPGKDLFTPGTITIYLVFVVLLLVVAAYVYKLRPAEAAGDVIAFSIIRPVFKYGVTFCTMLLVGVYFASISSGAFSIIVLGYTVGSLLGYLTAEILLQKSFQVWSAYKGYLGYIAVITMLLFGIATDVTGYVHRVPEPEKVKKVYFGTSISEWVRLEKLKDEDWSVKYEGVNFFEDPENIKNIILLHRQLLEQPSEKKNGNRYIIYTLDNGDYLVRQYYIDEKQYASLLKPVYESLEYKQARFPVVAQDPAEIKMIEIDDDRTPKRPVILIDRNEIREFAARLKQDVLNITFEELIIGTRVPLSDPVSPLNAAFDEMVIGAEGNVHINVVDINDRAAHYTLYPSYRAVIDWLKDKGYYENIMLLPEEIEYAVLEYPLSSGVSQTATGKSASRQVEIRDRQVIGELLSIRGPDDFSGGGKIISVLFYGRTTAGGSFQFQRFIHQDWPFSETLRGYLKQLD